MFHRDISLEEKDIQIKMPTKIQLFHVFKILNQNPIETGCLSPEAHTKLVHRLSHLFSKGK